jgi:hypothetical protein
VESSNAAVRTIGRMARKSGLSISALRFYDGAGVLTPARVDLPVDGRPTPVDGAALRAAVAAAPARRMRRDGAEYEVTVLEGGPDGVRITDGPGVAVNREFLLEALDAGGGGQLLLSLDGPIAPLAITSEAPPSVSLLMPVRLQKP